ncbi:MAG: HAMP domain-containing protein [Prolixibacteraceae bacterium]|nr:HAMP domain-containing protein [Prolixibacteraceae bacterium]MBN2745474.1 HAMP domain-containing protein [Bacteroidales bacterium]
MKIKSKLILGLGALFSLIIFLSILGILKINSLSKATENILVDNYRTLEYARDMLKALDKIHADEKAIDIFKDNLTKQQNNITEIGETELTDSLAAHFIKLIQNQSDTLAPFEIRNDLNRIVHLNMAAIQEKSAIAQKKAKNAVLWIGVTAIFCFIISFILLLRLPGNIANPIRELTESTRQIAAKNYSQRVQLEKHNEFSELAKSFNSMAEKLEEYNNSNLARMMMAIKRMDALIEKMNEPVIGLDENRIIIFANDEARKITGLEKGHLVGKNADELAVTNDLMRELLQELFGASQKKGKEPLKIFADGKESYFEKEILNITLEPQGTQDKKLISQVILLRNVTSYKELDFAKTNFIATVSHEFKTPISSIKMSLQLLEKNQIGPLNNEQKNLITSIKDDADRLLNITGELLNMTQVESGKIQLSIIPANAKDILNYAIKATKMQAEQKKISLEIDCSPELPRVLVDSEKTAWVLTNLISNAIRYSYDNSTIHLTIKEQNKKVLISVKDTGQGIAPQYKDKIFNRYFRIPGTKKEGVGLGLSISKEFIEAQGGQITVESEFGSGSSFTVMLNSFA